MALISMVAKDSPSTLGGTKVSSSLPLLNYIDDSVAHGDVVQRSVRPFEQILVQVLKQFHNRCELNMSMSVPNFLELWVIFNDESVAAEGPFSNYSATRFAIWVVSFTLLESHGGVAPHVEVSDLLERPWATLNTILGRV